jgi:AcrR family transcriptional regulator
MVEGLRERRRLQTQAEVANVAIELVIERGLANVTADDIAAHAGISRSTFFNYFPSKEAALVFGPPPIDEAPLKQFIVDSSSPVKDGLLHLLVDYGRRVEVRRPNLDRMNLVVQENPHLLGHVYRDLVGFHAAISAAVLQRIPGDQVFADAAGAAATAAVYAATQRWLQGAGAVTLDIALGESFAAIQALFQDTTASANPGKDQK